jgi:quinol monooxygenase YgiN
MRRVLIVIAQYLTKPGAAEEVARVLRRHAADSQAEPGCLEFTVHQSTDSPERFVLYERYTGEDAFEAHRTSPHFAANIEQAVIPLLAERTFSRYAILEAG